MQIISDTGAPLTVTELHLCKQILVALAKEYPSMARGWTVILNKGGIVQIVNQMLSGRFGFVLRTAAIDPEMRKVRRAAGEMLERYAIRRVKNVDALAEIIGRKRSIRGELEYAA